MWIFAPLGLLMPAAIPADKVDPKYLGPDGDFDLQIRVRAVSHLENFIRDYATPLGLEHSEIQETPEMDYNARIYMRQRDFAVAMAHMVMDIDYKKFKPTAEDKNEDGTLKYREGKAYHNTLNSIWGTVCLLGKPGGKWGPYSETNPNGYRASRWGTPGDYLDTAWGRAYREPTLADEIGMESEALFDWRKDEGESVWGTGDYVPDSEDRRLNLLWEMEDIPTDQWPDFLSKEEMDAVRSEYEFLMEQERKQTRKASRKSRRKNRRKSRA